VLELRPVADTPLSSAVVVVVILIPNHARFVAQSAPRAWLQTIAVACKCSRAQNPCMGITRITGSQFHAARAFAGLSRETLAERAGVSRYSILKWENSSHAVPNAMYQHICRAVDVIEAEGVRFSDGGVHRERPSAPVAGTVLHSEGAAA
jgi:Predicted transcriptional regulators